MKMKNILAGLLPLAAMGDALMSFDVDGLGSKPRYKKSMLTNKQWTKRKKRIANEKRARAINRK